MTTHAFPVLKLAPDVTSPHWLTDVTNDVGEISFDAGNRFGRLARSSPRRSRADDGEDDEGTLDGAMLRLSGGCAEWLRPLLRRAALDGEEVYVEFFPDGEVPGRIKVVGACRVTSTSLRAGTARSSRRRWMFDADDDGWRDDEFVLSFSRGARSERVTWR